MVVLDRRLEKAAPVLDSTVERSVPLIDFKKMGHWNMITMKKPAAATAALCFATGLAVTFGGMASAAEEVSYRLDVEPILQSRCVSCHQQDGDGLKASGLDLSSYEGLMKGTKHGPIIVPGDPLVSNLNVLIEGRASASLRMPHNQRPLLRAQQDIIRDWVKQGAKNN